MAHHKRRRPKHQRGGCLYCKPQKDERRSKTATLAPSVARRTQVGRDERRGADE